MLLAIIILSILLTTSITIILILAANLARLRSELRVISSARGWSSDTIVLNNGGLSPEYRK